MTRVLLTGSSGHLGSRTLGILCLKCEVHAVVRNRPANPEHGVTYHEIDLSKPFSTESLPQNVDGVVHLAQSRDYREFPQRALDIFQVNVAATTELLDYAYRAGATRFILASTGGLYKPSDRIITQDTPLDPPEGVLAYYFRTKLAAELLARSYSKIMNVSVLRPFFIYGPGQTGDKLISRLIASVRSGRKVQLSGRDGLRLNPIHVDDAAELISVLLDHACSRTLNVAGPDTVSIREIAETAGKLLNRKPAFEILPGASEKIVADSSPLASLLGRELCGFEAGLRTVIGSGSSASVANSGKDADET